MEFKTAIYQGICFYIIRYSPTNWETFSKDKNNATFYIYNNKKVPKQLAKKLVKARRQLERRGVLEPFIGADYL